MAKNCDQSDLDPMVRSRVCLRKLSPSTHYSRLRIEENKTRDFLMEYLPRRVEPCASVLYLQWYFEHHSIILLVLRGGITKNTL